MSIKLLIITPTYPPYQGSHTERMVAMVDALKDMDFEISILTTEILKGNPSYNPAMDKEYDGRIKIYRTKFGFLHRGVYARNTGYVDVKYSSESNDKNTSNLSNIKSKVVQILEKVKNKVLLPDTLIDWYFPVMKYVRENKLVEKIKPDYIVSCSMPNSAHVISYRLSKKYNIPMIMDIADPWAYLSYYNRGKIAFCFERHLEKKYLNYAKLACFSTQGAADLYIDKYSLQSAKTLTVVTGYNENLLTRKVEKQESVSKNIRLIYGGALQLGVRKPEDFIRAILKMKEYGIEMHIRTDNVFMIKNMIPNMEESNILVEKYAPFDTFYHEMLEADVLVYFGNTTVDQLPGKIFNYIPTGKLIFYISNIEDEKKDQALGIVKDYGHAVIVKNNTESIVEGLYKLVKMREQGLLGGTENVEKIEKYSSKAQFKKLADKIIEISEGVVNV